MTIRKISPAGNLSVKASNQISSNYVGTLPTKTHTLDFWKSYGERNEMFPVNQ